VLPTERNFPPDGAELPGTLGGVLQVRELAVEVGGRPTLEGASFSARPGDTVGLVGRNGAGKTSLLRVLAGVVPPAAGTVLRSGRVGWLPQDPRTPASAAPRTALDHVLSGRDLDRLTVRMEKLRVRLEEDASDANLARHARAVEAFEHAGGYAAESEVRTIAAGLGLASDRLDLPVRVLSGGERRRVELARILFAGSDLLLLDEPTNHLDSDAKQWLMGFLRSYRGALVVVSHDLALLDEAITRILHLDEGELIEYRGTWSQYRAARAADEARRAKQAAAQEAEIGRLSALADSMRGSTEKRARKAKVLDQRVTRLRAAAVTAPTRERRVAVRLPDPPHAGRVVLEVDALAQGYGGPPVFTDVSFTLERRERLLVMGLNGAGKTSLLRILAGETAPLAGGMRTGLNASVGYYAQEHEGIEVGKDLLTHLREHAEHPLSVQRGILGMFGLTGEMAFQDAGTLSGGEKTKLALAQLTAGRHNVLLLDEPTNNLDPPSRSAVGAALASWKGAMVIVSHDPEFVRRLGPHRVLLMPDGTVDHWTDELLDLVALA
jgi:ATPase subunit of ABC transporter with duplicated ATPase domains